MQYSALSTPHGDAEALILTLSDSADPAPAMAVSQSLATAVPRCAFASLALAKADAIHPVVALRTLIATEATKLRLASSQVILMGSGAAGLQALDLALLGVVPGSSAIISDIAPAPMPIVPLDSTISLRFVQHFGADEPVDAAFGALIHTLRLSSLDIRAVTLPEGSDTANRALAAFLIELVANASRYTVRTR